MICYKIKAEGRRGARQESVKITRFNSGNNTAHIKKSANPRCAGTTKKQTHV